MTETTCTQKREKERKDIFDERIFRERKNFSHTFSNPWTVENENSPLKMISIYWKLPWCHENVTWWSPSTIHAIFHDMHCTDNSQVSVFPHLSTRFVDGTNKVILCGRTKFLKKQFTCSWQLLTFCCSWCCLPLLSGNTFCAEAS